MPRSTRGTSTVPRVADVLQQALAQERKELQFSDLTVLVEGSEFHCHRFVLAAISGFFRSLLSSGMREATERKVQLHDFSSTVFTDVMRWIYDGDLTITFDNALDLLPAADQLDIAPLKLECIEFLGENMTQENCVSIYRTSNLFHCEDLKAMSWDYLLKTFDSVCSYEEIFKLSPEDMMRLITDPKLVTQTEDNVVENVLKWLAYEMLDTQCLEGSTTDGSDKKHMQDVRNAFKTCQTERSSQSNSEDHNKEVITDGMAKDVMDSGDSEREESFKTNQTPIATDENTEASTNSVVIESRSRISRLVELLKATRYLLVSSNCLWGTLAKDPIVQADERCRGIFDEILHHKTRLDRHQNEWKAAETHRESDQLTDVVLTCMNNTLSCRLSCDGSWKNVSGGVNLHMVSQISYFDNDIYIRLSNKNLYVFMPKYNSCPCIMDASSSNISTYAMFPVGNELISVCSISGSDTYAVESVCLKSSKHTQWKQVGQLFTQGMEVASVTNIDRKLIVFWKKGGQSYLNIECFDLIRGESFLLPDQISSSAGLVTFKHDDQAFAVQQNGALWRICTKAEAPYISLKLELWLWNFHRAVSGAILVSEELWMFEPTPKTTSERVAVKLEGVFKEVRFCSTSVHQTGFIHAVLPKSVIGS
ncbi:kelch-like 40 [Elysia marginata]|uniref:Kelch-like 40 n=1 Tax=Elysia marginata TaxID=1093978 RepID=A0AAV4EW22_9GAST|nr:kelch-like 40 [Elysia marginata]